MHVVPSAARAAALTMRLVRFKHACFDADTSRVHTPTQQPGSTDAGFTMIEVIVVFLLLAVVLGFAFRPLLQGLSGADSTQAQALASQRATEALELVRADVQSAFAPDRDARHIRDVEKLRRALTDRTFVTYSDDFSYGTRRLDVRDIVRATPTELHVRSDVLAADRNAPVECVRWQVPPASSSTWWVRRTVYANERSATGTACSGGTITNDLELPSAPRIAGRTPTAAFAYELLQPNCSTVRRATVTGLDLNRIVAVHVTFVASGARRKAFALDTASTVVIPTARETTEYRRALGCG